MAIPGRKTRKTPPTLSDRRPITPPLKSVSSKTFHVSVPKLGDYDLNLSGLKFPTPDGVPLSSENLVPDTQARLMENYLFVGQGTLHNPAISDVRIRYEALSNGIQATVLAALAPETTLKPHLGPRNLSIYRLFAGSRAEAIATPSREHTIMTWSLQGADS
ncbi:hypothetical protein C7271_08170 [filamentous cyanobacterium CCP5]|nr:hypothetical protein C7271_08170 [filamentous cyanobacterium CCP5]